MAHSVHLEGGRCHPRSLQKNENGSRRLSTHRFPWADNWLQVSLQILEDHYNRSTMDFKHSIYLLPTEDLQRAWGVANKWIRRRFPDTREETFQQVAEDLEFPWGQRVLPLPPSLVTNSSTRPDNRLVQIAGCMNPLGVWFGGECLHGVAHRNRALPPDNITLIPPRHGLGHKIGLLAAGPCQAPWGRPF